MKEYEKFGMEEFVGREKELGEVEKQMREFARKNTRILNICGEGGIGKTRFMKKLSEIPERLVVDYTEESGIKGNYSCYVNLSGCQLLPSLLLRFRQELDEERFDFQKFDTAYILFYDMFAFERQKDFIDANKAMEGNKGEYLVTDADLKNSWNIAKVIIKAAYNSIKDTVLKSKGSILPLAKNVPIAELIDTIRDAIKDVEKRNEIIKILQDLNGETSAFNIDSKLLDYFMEGLSSGDENIVYFYFLDNFEQVDIVDNRKMFFERLGKIPAFWCIASRERLNLQQNEEAGVLTRLELTGLNGKDCEKIIRRCNGFDNLNEENQKEIIFNIVNASGDIDMQDHGYDNLEEMTASPIFVKAMCNILETEIQKAQELSMQTVDAKRFKFFHKNTDIPLAYYFEMGKSKAELDCFHTLACKEVWSTKMLSILSRNLGIYLLNARHLLFQDSMIESVTTDSIKLHNRIAHSLQVSFNNRIKYDVYEIMAEYFSDKSQKHLVTDAEELQDFYEFTKEFCTNIINGEHPYLATSAFKEFEKFYENFCYCMKVIKPMFATQKHIEIYYNVIESLKEYAEQGGCIESEKRKVAEAFHTLGVFLSDRGDSKKALGIDAKAIEYLKNMPNLKIEQARAYNDYAYDLSAYHKYKEAQKNGNSSIKICIDIINDFLNLSESESRAKDILDCYKIIAESDEKVQNLKDDVLQTMEIGAKRTEKCKNEELEGVFQQILTTRGNIPWYYLKDEEVTDEKAKYAINFGKNTYLLRKWYYKESHKNTLTSLHNLQAYRLKYCELIMEEKFQSGIEIDLDDMLFTICKNLEELVEKRGKNEKVDKKTEESGENAKRELVSSKDIENMKDEAKKRGFENIYPIDKIKEVFDSREELFQYALEGIESLQYLSNAKYDLARIAATSEKREKYLSEAIKCADYAAMVRAVKWGMTNRKTLESMRYAAEYIWYGAKNNCKFATKEEAQKRMAYAAKYINKEEVGEKHYKEYQDLLKKMETGKEE